MPGSVRYYCTQESRPTVNFSALYSKLCMYFNVLQFSLMHAR